MNADQSYRMITPRASDLAQLTSASVGEVMAFVRGQGASLANTRVFSGAELLAGGWSAGDVRELEELDLRSNRQRSWDKEPTLRWPEPNAYVMALQSSSRG